MTYLECLPFFATSSMPAIPADWKDTTGTNDVAAVFEATAGDGTIFIFVNHSDADERDLPDSDRFWIYCSNGDQMPDGAEADETDDWDEALRIVERLRCAGEVMTTLRNATSREDFETITGLALNRSNADCADFARTVCDFDGICRRALANYPTIADHPDEYGYMWRRACDDFLAQTADDR